MKTAPDQIKSFVDRIENINEQVKSFNDDKRDIYAEAKSHGFDVKALKIVIQRRAKDPDQLSELEAVVETYEAALGTPVATRARAEPPPSFREVRGILKRADAVPSADIPDIPECLDRRARAS